jgi:hypothetical protein
MAHSLTADACSVNVVAFFKNSKKFKAFSFKLFRSPCAGHNSDIDRKSQLAASRTFEGMSLPSKKLFGLSSALLYLNVDSLF